MLPTTATALLALISFSSLSYSLPLSPQLRAPLKTRGVPYQVVPVDGGSSSLTTTARSDVKSNTPHPSETTTVTATTVVSASAAEKTLMVTTTEPPPSSSTAPFIAPKIFLSPPAAAVAESGTKGGSSTSQLALPILPTTTSAPHPKSDSLPTVPTLVAAVPASSDRPYSPSSPVAQATAALKPGNVQGSTPHPPLVTAPPGPSPTSLWHNGNWHTAYAYSNSSSHGRRALAPSRVRGAPGPSAATGGVLWARGESEVASTSTTPTPSSTAEVNTPKIKQFKKAKITITANPKPKADTPISSAPLPTLPTVKAETGNPTEVPKLAQPTHQANGDPTYSST